MLDTTLLYTLLLCVFILVLARKWRKHGLPYPPGPKGYPLLGNVLDLPASIPIWENLTSLAGYRRTDILYLRVMGKDMVILSSNKAISHLIGRRSTIYADRDQSEMTKLTGVHDWAIAMLPYGDRWRARRRLCHEALNVRLAWDIEPHQYKQTHRLLARLLDSPECFMYETEFMAGALIMSVTYGLDIKSADDPFLSAMMEANQALFTVSVPGKFLVDVLPILRYLPDWLPGTGFKALAKEAHDKYKLSRHGPMEYVKNAMKSGEAFPQSITSDCLSRLEDHGEMGFDEEVIRDMSGAMFGAGAETTKVLVQTFFLAMVLNPGVMNKAQEELDRVIGKDRLPDFSDKDDLPYIGALLKELLRWNPPLPFSFPSRITLDDEYQGYFIPAGATVIQNIWAIFRDPDIYPEPEAFNPDRFLKDGKLNPLVFDPEVRVFGAGRRICPGRHFALRTVYLAISCVLSVFDIAPPMDDDGSPEVPEAEFNNLMIRNPKPFKCTIKPRSEDTIKLVKEACGRASH